LSAGQVLVFVLSALAGKPDLPTVELYGRRFVDLSAWASANRLELHWDKASGQVELTNRCTKLAFTVDSRCASINGVVAWLSVPITPRNHDVYVAAIDLQTLLGPLLSPVKNKPRQFVRTVALDPGHGGKDPGNEAGAEQEKTHALLLAQRVRYLLQEAGLGVVLTRSSDKFVDLAARVRHAKRRRADLFLSLHYNATDPAKNGVKGVEVYCLTPAGAPSTNARSESGSARAASGNANNAKNVLLAYQIQKAMVNDLGMEDRGVRRARFVVLRAAEMPAVLIEGGFMTDPEEAAQIFDPSHREELAHAIVEGVLAYKRLVER
jgi:N-acetylmuramoyl-L-alanine amidase